MSNVARGEEFYQRALDFHTTIKGMTPKEIHDFGLVSMKLFLLLLLLLQFLVLPLLF